MEVYSIVLKMEDLRTQLAEMHQRFEAQEERYHEQSSALHQARAEQREAMSLAKAMIEHQTVIKRQSPAVYIPRDRKIQDFCGFP